MTYDYSKLNGKIVEIYKTRYAFAKAMGWSNHTMSCKLNNKVPWRQADIEKAIGLLSVDRRDVGDYFFTKEVKSA